MTELRKGTCRENQSVPLWPRETWRSSSLRSLLLPGLLVECIYGVCQIFLLVLFYFLSNFILNFILVFLYRKTKNEVMAHVIAKWTRICLEVDKCTQQLELEYSIQLKY